jgi:hypothetical protein
VNIEDNNTCNDDGYSRHDPTSNKH